MGVLNRAAIKQEAREFLSNDKKWFKMFLAIAIFYILTNLGSIELVISRFADFSHGIDYFFDYYNSAKYENGFNFSIKSSVFDLLDVIMLPFAVAVSGYFLNHLRGFNPEWKSLYKEGFDNYGKYFATMFITGLSIGLWTLLFIIPGIIKAFEYSQVDYIIHDNKNLKPYQAKQISSLITSGYKSQIFVLELSFIGWYIAGAFTLGLTYIYALPYISTVRAMYYENLKSNAIEKGIVAPEAFMSEPPVYQNYQQDAFNQEPYTSQNYNNPYKSSQPVNNSFTAENYQDNNAEQSFSNPLENKATDSEFTQNDNSNDDSSQENFKNF